MRESSLVRTPTPAEIDALFEQWDRPESPGCALGVYLDGEIIYEKGYGMASLEHQVAINPDSVFYIASVAKQFTAMCIFLLEEEGRLSLDDDLKTHFPELQFDMPITILQLVHHTAGIRDYFSLVGIGGLTSCDIDREEKIVALLARQKDLNFEPGAEHLYSNSGYVLLASLVRRITGTSLRDFAAKRIFAPLDMTNSLFRDDLGLVVVNRASGYDAKPDGSFRLAESLLDSVVGDGGAFSTIRDFSKWEKNFLKPKVGAGRVMENMLCRGTAAGSEISYAGGLSHGSHRGISTVGHNGGFPGFRAGFTRYPEHRLTVVCLANAGTLPASDMPRRVAELYLSDVMTLRAEPAFVDVDATTLQKHVGYYRDRTSLYRVVELENDRLVIDVGGLRLPLRPISDDRFRTVDVPIDITIEFGIEEGVRTLSVVPDDDDPNPDPAMKAIEPLAISAEEATALKGSYRNQELGAEKRVDGEGSSLRIVRPNGREIPLEPMVPGEFRAGPAATIKIDRKGASLALLLTDGRARNVRFELVSQGE